MKKTAAPSILVAVVMFAVAVMAEAQQPKKVARVGYLIDNAAQSATDFKPFHDRMRELGYIEGTNIAYEPRYWDGKAARLPELAADLVRLNCAVIVAIGNEAARAAKNATKEIPIVITNTNDAVRNGFVVSLARPGGNITGLTNLGGELYGKRLELLKEIIPKLARVGFLWASASLTALDNLKDSETAAPSLRVQIQSLEVLGPDDIERKIQSAGKLGVQALLVESSGFFTAHQSLLIEQVSKSRLPAMYGNTRYVEAGGLMTYSFDRKERFRRTAEYVDKILQGKKPADLPVERPSKLEFVINLKAAKQIGLTIPPNVLARATKIIR
jgi:putative tryptophan/tyrosine transport system substrate-binding protein